MMSDKVYGWHPISTSASQVSDCYVREYKARDMSFTNDGDCTRDMILLVTYQRISIQTDEDPFTHNPLMFQKVLKIVGSDHDDSSDTGKSIGVLGNVASVRTRIDMLGRHV